ncbi:MAG TPA: TraR/DksA C4-type zinc finger protein [Anaeromyxobacteraceae bacterium]|nr:TraR/DksA C4-type zinc finger protein [Anaeromyxobacteraceae bacterium]
MNAKQRAAYERSLRQAREQLVRTGPAKIEPNRRDPVSTGVADEDAQALSEMMQVLASQRNKGQADLLARIDRALRKLATEPDDYGLCEQCEEPIAPKRLALMPYALLCTACQAAREPKRAQTRRKLNDVE